MTPKKKFQWSRGDDGEGGETHYTERASRGEAARANDRIFRLGKALVEIDTARLDALTLSDDIRDALDEARRLRDLEDENRKLKRLVADLSLDKMALEEVLKKL